jgi:hypothetical protein
MSVQSFGNNILAAKVKTLQAQHDLQLSNMDASGYGFDYTHHINGPNVTNPNNYVFNLFERAAGGQQSRDIITVSSANNGTPPFNEAFLTLKADYITFDGLTNFVNNNNNGQAIIASGATSVVVTGGIQNVTANSVILLTQASPDTGGTSIYIPLLVAAGVPANGDFTISTPTAITVTGGVKVNYSIVKY